MTSAQRKDLRNGVWLCEVCAKRIDADPGAYAPEVLVAWRHGAEARALAGLDFIPSSPDRQRSLIPPPPPHDCVPRPELLEQAVGSVLGEGGNTRETAFVSRVQGVGGFGKTVLAECVCADQRVTARFGDRMHWVALGQQADTLTLGRALVQSLGGFDLQPTTIPQYRVLLQGLVEADPAPTLIVLDDAWTVSDIADLMVEADNCHYLITTRNLDLVPHAQTVHVDEMGRDQSLQLLATTFGDDLPGDAQQVIEMVGRWPLLLRLAGRAAAQWASKHPGREHEAFSFVSDRLAESGITALDGYADRNAASSATLELSLGLLPGADREAASLLGVFAEDITITLGLAGTLLDRTASHTLELIMRLDDHGLCTFDSETEEFRLHDLVRDYLRSTASDLGPAHLRLARLLDVPPLRATAYADHYLTHHLLEAGAYGDLCDRVLSPSWNEDFESIARRPALLMDLERAIEASSRVGRQDLSVSLACRNARFAAASGGSEVLGILAHASGQTSLLHTARSLDRIGDLVSARSDRDELQLSKLILMTLIELAEVGQSGRRGSPELVAAQVRLEQLATSPLDVPLHPRNRHGLSAVIAALSGSIDTASASAAIRAEHGVWMLLFDSLVLASAGHIETADRLVSSALRSLDEVEDPHWIVLATCVGATASAIGDRDTGLSLARQALDRGTSSYPPGAAVLHGMRAAQVLARWSRSEVPELVAGLLEQAEGLKAELGNLWFRSTQVEAISALLEAGDESAAAVLVRSLVSGGRSHDLVARHASKVARRRWALALAHHGSFAAVSSLRRKQHDPVLGSLAHIGAFLNGRDVDRLYRAFAAAMKVRGGRDRVDLLVFLAGVQASAGLKADAVESLDASIIESGDRAPVYWLEDPSLVVEVARAAVELRGPEVMVDTLIEYFSGEDLDHVLVDHAKTIVELGASNACHDLIAISDDSPAVAVAVAQALVSLDRGGDLPGILARLSSEEVVDVIEGALTDGTYNDSVAGIAASIAAMDEEEGVGPSRAVAFLLDLVAVVGSDDVRGFARLVSEARSAHELNILAAQFEAGRRVSAIGRSAGIEALFVQALRGRRVTLDREGESLAARAYRLGWRDVVACLVTRDASARHRSCKLQVLAGDAGPAAQAMAQEVTRMRALETFEHTATPDFLPALRFLRSLGAGLDLPVRTQVAAACLVHLRNDEVDLNLALAALASTPEFAEALNALELGARATLDFEFSKADRDYS